jgi:hypothetical protein
MRESARIGGCSREPTMNATLPLLAAAPLANGTMSPVEYVRGLSPDEKEAVFRCLLREVVELHAD